MKTLTEITDYPDLLARIDAFFDDGEDEEAVDNEETLPVFPEYSSEQFLDEVFMDEERYDATVGVLRAKRTSSCRARPAWVRPSPPSASRTR